MLHCLHCLFIAEKTGDANQQIPVEGHDLAGEVGEVTDVFIEVGDLVNRHPPLNSTADGAWFVMCEIRLGLGPELGKKPG